MSGNSLRKLGSGFLVFAVLTGGVLGTAAAAQGATVLRGVTVAGVRVAGLEGASLLARLRPAARAAEERPLVLYVGDRSWTRRPADFGITVDVAGTAERALRTGRENPLRWIVQTFTGEPLSLPWVARVDAAALRRGLADLADLVRVEASNGEVGLEGKDVIVKPPDIGVALVSDAARRQLIEAVTHTPGEARIPLPVTITPPPIGADQVARVESQARAILSASVEFTLEGKVITLPPEAIARAFAIRVGRDPESGADHDRLLLQVDPPKLEAEITGAAPWAFRPPRDATFTVDGTRARVVPSEEGRSVDAASAAAALILLDSHGDRAPIELGPRAVPASFTTDAARSLGIRERISIFTTTFDPQNAPRVSNIDLMASSIDGKIVRAGETFSLNDTTGPRTPDRGYKEAAIIVDGELVPGIGGGVCQVGTTLFNAALSAGIPIVERSNHSLYISRYPLGRDATVNYGYQDLKFRNDTAYGLLLVAGVTSKALTISIYSSPLGRTVEYTTSERRNFRPPPTKYVDDPTLPAAQEVVQEEGSAGFDVTVIRTVTDGGQILHRGTFVSKYRPWKRIVRRGTGSTPSPSPAAP